MYEQEINYESKFEKISIKDLLSLLELYKDRMIYYRDDEYDCNYYKNKEQNLLDFIENYITGVE